MKPVFVWVMYFTILTISAEAESFRTLLEGTLELSSDSPEGSYLSLPYNGSALISLEGEIRFLRGIELELSAPQPWLAYRGSLAMLIYAELDRQPSVGINDLEGRRIAFEPLPNRIKTVYQIPVRLSHGLRTTPYAIVPVGTTLPSSFPILFSLTPIIKGLSEDVEQMLFLLTARPILGDEGTLRITFRYPDQLRGRPFTVLIDNVVVEDTAEEQFLKEGEHHLAVLSDDYRNESRRFVVEKAKRLDIVIDLQDTTPLLIFEAPENAIIFLNNNPVSRGSGPIPVEPGTYEAKFQVGDYTLTKIITVQRGKIYRVALAVDIDVEESE